MSAEAHVDPTREAFNAFKALPRDVPIQMLNLLRYRDVAAYPEGHENAGRAGQARAPIRNMVKPVGRFSSASGAASCGAVPFRPY